MCPKPHNPYSCFESEQGSTQLSASCCSPELPSHSADVPCSVGARGAQIISSERDSLPMFGSIPSQTIVSQMAESVPVHSFSQDIRGGYRAIKRGGNFTRLCTMRMH